MIPNSLYVYLGLALTSVLGWSWGIYEHHVYKQYRAEVQSTAKAQQIISEQTNKWNEKLIKEAQNDYEKRVSAINTKYGRLHYSCSSTMSDTDSKQDSTATAGKTPNDVFAGRDVVKDCAITTNMLVTLQDILKTTKEK